jgi:hypothetical protein
MANFLIHSADLYNKLFRFRLPLFWLPSGMFLLLDPLHVLVPVVYFQHAQGEQPVGAPEGTAAGQKGGHIPEGFGRHIHPADAATKVVKGISLKKKIKLLVGF